jgi:hypothetical protein
MRYPRRFTRILLSASVCLALAGCFSYTKEEHSTGVPAADQPTTSSTTTTSTVPDTSTTTTTEKQHTTTYTP